MQALRAEGPFSGASGLAQSPRTVTQPVSEPNKQEWLHPADTEPNKPDSHPDPALTTRSCSNNSKLASARMFVISIPIRFYHDFKILCVARFCTIFVLIP